LRLESRDVKPAPFDYHRPASLGEAVALLERYGDDGRVLAGGQSLVPALNMRLATPRALIDINRVAGLDAVRPTAEGLVLGALVRHEELERSPRVAAQAPLLAQAAPHIGHAAIRARGTLGGSVALADPAAELPACLVALGAEVRVTGPKGARAVAAGDFFRGVYATALGPAELVTEILVPPLAAGWRSTFLELARRHGDFALAGLAACARVDRGAIAEIRLVFCGVGAAPVRARSAEAALAGRRPGPEVLAAAGRELDADLDPPGDLHGGPALRRQLARVLLARAVGGLVE
jgi:carbon-monoxide dehydrogenase medium subunit